MNVLLGPHSPPAPCLDSGGWDAVTSLTTHSPSPSPRRARGAFFNSRFGTWTPNTKLQARRRGAWCRAQIPDGAVLVNGEQRGCTNTGRYACQRLRTDVVRGLYDRWTDIWETDIATQPHCRDSVFGAQFQNRLLKAPLSPGGARGVGGEWVVRALAAPRGWEFGCPGSYRALRNVSLGSSPKRSR